MAVVDDYRLAGDPQTEKRVGVSIFSSMWPPSAESPLLDRVSGIWRDFRSDTLLLVDDDQHQFFELLFSRTFSVGSTAFACRVAEKVSLMSHLISARDHVRLHLGTSEGTRHAGCKMQGDPADKNMP